ncbi:MAG TPA: acetoacetate decarboxylase family protein [Capillimicrobium sp.]|nr:acetoacetate decarboxylase family protein [Capillimicrobium sp.]
MPAEIDRTEDDVVDPRLLERAQARRPEDHGPATFPLTATNASLLGVTYSVPLEQAWALLPATERLVPVRVTPRRAAILFFAWDVRRSDLGPYQELGAALPVVLDAPKAPAPLPPALWRDPAIGLYSVELPVDSERCAEAGSDVLGLPHVVGDASMRIDHRGGSARFAFDGRTMAELEVRLTRWPRERRHDVSFQTYSLLEGRILRSRLSAVGEGYRGRRGSASLGFGDHRRAQRLARLDLSRRPLELRVLPRVNWVNWGPEDLGPL